MTFEQLATVLAPFVAALGAAAWLHGQLGALREQQAAMQERFRNLERDLDRLRSQLETRRWDHHGEPRPQDLRPS